MSVVRRAPPPPPKTGQSNEPPKPDRPLPPKPTTRPTPPSPGRIPSRPTSASTSAAPPLPSPTNSIPSRPASASLSPSTSTDEAVPEPAPTPAPTETKSTPPIPPKPKIPVPTPPKPKAPTSTESQAPPAVRPPPARPSFSNPNPNSPPTVPAPPVKPAIPAPTPAKPEPKPESTPPPAPEPKPELKPEPTVPTTAPTPGSTSATSSQIQPALERPSTLSPGSQPSLNGIFAQGEGKFGGRGLLEIPELKNMSDIQVAMAFVRSEECYLKMGLQCVTTEFETRLAAHIKLGRPILTQDDMQRLFLNIGNIYDFNRQLFSELEALQNNGEEILLGNLGATMKKYIPFFKLYQKYVEKHREISQLFNKWLKKNDQFEFFVKLNELTSGQKLRTLLSAPVNRLAQYLIFLGGVHEKMEPSSPGYVPLEEAIRSIQIVADDIAQKCKENKARELCTKVQTEIFKGAVEVLSPTRYANKVGDLELVGEKSKLGKGRVVKKHVFALFNDCLLFGLSGGALSKGTPKGVFRLDGLTVVEAEDDTKANILHAFEIRHPALGGGALLVCAPSAADRGKWIQAIEKAAADYATQKQSSGLRDAKAISDDDFEVQICKKKPKRDYFVQPITSGSPTPSNTTRTTGSGSSGSPGVNSIWLKKFDESSGYHYYENQETGESSWEPPAGWVEPTATPTPTTTTTSAPAPAPPRPSKGAPPPPSADVPDAPPMDADAPEAPPPDDTPLAPDPSTPAPEPKESGSSSGGGGGDTHGDLLSAIRGAGGVGALKSAAKRVPPPMRSGDGPAPRGASAPPKPDLQSTLQKSLANYRQFVQDDDDKDDADEDADWE